MKFIRGVIGFALAGIVINTLWGVFVNNFGILGGYISALILTGSMWFLNHSIGLIQNDKDSAFVDMGLGVGICLVVRDMINNGVISITSSVPTFLCVTVGSVLGGIAAGLIEKELNKNKTRDKNLEGIRTQFLND